MAAMKLTQDWGVKGIDGYLTSDDSPRAEAMSEGSASCVPSSKGRRLPTTRRTICWKPPSSARALVIVVVDGADWFIALGTAIYGLMEASWVAGEGDRTRPLM
jgi:acetyl-CoA acetyltransferase